MNGRMFGCTKKKEGGKASKQSCRQQMCLLIFHLAFVAFLVDALHRLALAISTIK
jgi:hypothetical protein